MHELCLLKNREAGHREEMKFTLFINCTGVIGLPELLTWMNLAVQHSSMRTA